MRLKHSTRPSLGKNKNVYNRLDFLKTERKQEGQNTKRGPRSPTGW